MIRKNGFRTLLVVFLAFSLTSSMLVGIAMIGFSNTDTNYIEMTNSFSTSAIAIDGNLTPGEWDDAEHVISWYMDADPENYDGYNYMYLAEDHDFLYIALDLVSDQTDDVSQEWVGFWLNTNETVVDEMDSVNSTSKWEAALDSGLESLIYDVDNSREMPFFNPNGLMAGFQTNLKSMDELTPINGTLTGTLEDISSWFDMKYANMTAVQNGTDYIYRLDAEIDVTEYYTVFKDLYADHTLWVDFKVNYKNNATLKGHYLTIRDETGAINVTDSAKTVILRNDTALDEEELRITQDYFTEDNRVLVTLFGICDTPFNTSLDKITLTFMANSTYHNELPYMVGLPYTSINGYEIAWAFWETENNATAHRSFEIKIPKSELEGYEMDSDFGILVGGYGTLSAWPNTNNWVFGTDTETGIPYQNTTAYLYYSMPLKGWVPTTTGSTSTTSSTTSTETTSSTISTTTTGETPTASTTTTNESTTPPPVDESLLLYITIIGAGLVGVIVIVVIIKLRK